MRGNPGGRRWAWNFRGAAREDFSALFHDEINRDGLGPFDCRAENCRDGRDAGVREPVEERGGAAFSSDPAAGKGMTGVAAEAMSYEVVERSRFCASPSHGV